MINPDKLNIFPKQCLHCNLVNTLHLNIKKSENHFKKVTYFFEKVSNAL